MCTTLLFGNNTAAAPAARGLVRSIQLKIDTKFSHHMPRHMKRTWQPGLYVGSSCLLAAFPGIMIFRVTSWILQWCTAWFSHPGSRSPTDPNLTTGGQGDALSSVCCISTACSSQHRLLRLYGLDVCCRTSSL